MYLHEWYSDNLARQEPPLAWVGENCLISKEGGLGQLCLCCIPKFIFPKVCNSLHDCFLDGWFVKLRQYRVLVQDFAPHCPGLVGDLRLCLLLSGQGSGASLLKQGLLAEQEPGL